MRTRTSILVAITVAAVVGLTGGRAEGANYTWINTASGVSDYWTNSANWVGGTYPANGDNAYMTNTIASGAYTNILDATLGGTLTALTISNSSAGQAWLYVTNAALNVTTFTLGNGGVLEIANAGVVTNNATANANWWYGNAGTITLNSGGRYVTANAVTIGASLNNGYATVSTRSSSGGTWELSSKALTIGTGTGTGNNTLRVTGPGVLVTNITTTGGRAGYTGLTLGYSGNSSSGNSLIISNGAKMAVNSGYVSTDLGQSGNRILVDNGTLTATDYIMIGWNTGGNNNSLTVTNGGYVIAGSAKGLSVGNGNATFTGYGATNNTVTVAGTNDSGAKATINLNAGQLWIGNASGGDGNLVLVGSGGIITNGSATVGGSGGTFNSLVVTNGGQLFSGSAASYIGKGGNSNTASIVGGSAGTSLWNLGNQSLYVGDSGATGNVLRVDGAGVDGGAVVTNIGAFNVGGNVGGAGANFNTLIITNGGKVFINNADLRVGSVGRFNNRLVIDGGTLSAGGYVSVGLGSAAGGGGTGGSNSVTVANGGYFNLSGGLYVGMWGGGQPYTSASNTVTVAGTNSAGARATINLNAGQLWIGNAPGATGNLVQVGNGGVITNAGAVNVGGSGGTFNSLVVTNGGQLFSGSAAHYIGNGATNNTVQVIGGSGGTSLWNLGGQTLGVGSGSATGNVLTVGSAGVVTNLASLTVPAANTLALGAGGQVYASAATDAGTLTVGIDDTATPACGRITVSGNLNISGAMLNLVTNGAPGASAYVIASYGTLTGTFAATNGLPFGYRLNTNYNSSNQIALEILPPPTLVSLNPANNATEIPIAPALAATFNTNIALVSGGVITLTNLTAGTAFATITLPDPQVTTNGAVLTITPASSLAYSSMYAVLIGTNAVKGLDTITTFAGITNDTTWRFTTMAPGVSILNQAASALTATSATLNATLAVPAGNADVQVFWGPTDGTDNPVAWSNNAYVGSWANVTSTNISFMANGFMADTRYYYTFRATNADTSVWASPSTTFATLRPSAAVARYWDGGVANIPGDGNGASAGGAGTWDATLQNWDAGAVPHAAWNSTYNDTAVFGGTAGMVTLGAPVTVGGLQFDTAGYVLTNNTLTFGAAGSLAVNADATIVSAIGGSAEVAKTGTGALTNSGDNTLTGLFSVRTGTVVNTTNWVGNGRGQQKAQVGGSATAALWTNTIPMTIGAGAAGVSNTFTVATQGTLRVNGGVVVGTNGAAYNALVVTNGGQAFSTAASTIGFNATNNSVLVVGGGLASLWNLGNAALTVGYGAGNGNVLTVNGGGVAGGAVVTNVGNTGGRAGYNGIALGYPGTLGNNSLIVSNGGQVAVATGYVACDLGSSGNRIVVDNGTLTGPSYIIIGWSGASVGSNNTLTVTNGGYVSALALAVGNGGNGPPDGFTGYGAPGNTVVVAGTNGSGARATLRLNGGGLWIGAADSATGVDASSNLVLIGNGGIITNAGAVTVGRGSGAKAATGNSLVITNGGQLFSTACTIGTSATNNSALVIGGSGGTSLWNLGNQPLTVGSAAATGNVLTVSAGGVVTNISTLTVAASNSVALAAGGQIYASAVTNAGALTVGINDSRSPACGRLTVSGNLNITGATLTLDVTGTLAQPVYIMASCDTLTGTFAATNGLPEGATLDYNYGGAKQIAFLRPLARGTVFSLR